jgi:hypothetical protein
MALAKIKSNSGNRTPGSSAGRFGNRAEYKGAAKRLRREEAKKAVEAWPDEYEYCKLRSEMS